MQANTNHIIQSRTLLSPAKAEEIAAKLSAVDDEFKYVAKHCPKGTGQSFVQIFDADGNILGTL